MLLGQSHGPDAGANFTSTASTDCTRPPPPKPTSGQHTALSATPTPTAFHDPQNAHTGVLSHAPNAATAARTTTGATSIHAASATLLAQEQPYDGAYTQTTTNQTGPYQTRHLQGSPATPPPHVAGKHRHDTMKRRTSPTLNFLHHQTHLTADPTPTTTS